MSATHQDRAGLVVLAAVFCILTVAASVAFAVFWASGVTPSSAPCVQIGGQTLERDRPVSTFPTNEVCRD